MGRLDFRILKSHALSNDMEDKEIPQSCRKYKPERGLESKIHKELNSKKRKISNGPSIWTRHLTKEDPLMGNDTQEVSRGKAEVMRKLTWAC